MADKRISQLVERTDIANNDVLPIVASGATTTNKVTISTIQDWMQDNLDVGVTSVGITLGTTGTDINVTGSPVTSSGNITINLPTASATNRGALSSADWSTFNSKQGAITLTTTGTSGVSTLVGNTLNIPNYTTDLSGYVTLGTAQTITAQKTFTTSGSSDTMIISHGSGSGFALDVIKAGSGEAIRVQKTSGSGNAMTISGGNFEAPTIVKTGGTSSQFLKADGSVDSNSYALNSSLSLYLPLSGGTMTGILNVGSGNLRIAAEGASNITILRNFTGTAQGQSGFNHIGFNNSNNFYFTKNLNNGCIFSFNNSAYRTYTFPDADATIASTSNLSAYLPLAGGTLTGALNGTSATFTGNILLSGSSAYVRASTTNGFLVNSNDDSTNLFIVTNAGRVGIGTTTPNDLMEIKSTSANQANYRLYNTFNDGANSFGINWFRNYDSATNSQGAFINYVRTGGSSGDLAFGTGTVSGGIAEAMRITSARELLFNKEVEDNAVQGLYCQNGYMALTATRVDGLGTMYRANRQGSDGKLFDFMQAGVSEGDISVSGTTVSYNGGHLSRYSQTVSNEKIDDLVKGTVMSNLDKMAEWINPETGGPYENEQLNCMKISDVEGDKNVAGVFVNWDNDDTLSTNDMNIAMTGDMIIRIAEGVLVEKGDLLISAGDGTAKPQSDDLIRSNTIAKVTSNHVTCVYEDGSYCVPCVLMAC
jgi:hypothetical protein